MDGEQRPERDEPEDVVSAAAREHATELLSLARSGRLSGFIIVIQKKADDNPDRMDIRSYIGAGDTLHAIGLCKTAERMMPKLADGFLDKLVI